MDRVLFTCLFSCPWSSASNDFSVFVCTTIQLFHFLHSSSKCLFHIEFIFLMLPIGRNFGFHHQTIVHRLIFYYALGLVMCDATSKNWKGKCIIILLYVLCFSCCFQSNSDVWTLSFTTFYCSIVYCSFGINYLRWILDSKYLAYGLR